jgi:hypothetical protein
MSRPPAAAANVTKATATTTHQRRGGSTFKGSPSPAARGSDAHGCAPPPTPTTRHPVERSPGVTTYPPAADVCGRSDGGGNEEPGSEMATSPGGGHAETGEGGGNVVEGAGGGNVVAGAGGNDAVPLSSASCGRHLAISSSQYQPAEPMLAPSGPYRIRQRGVTGCVTGRNRHRVSVDTQLTTSDDPYSGAHDLRSFFQNMGGVEGGRGAATAEDRTDATSDVDVLDTDPVRIDSDPLDVAGYVDGIQAMLRVRHIDHRPVTLAYVAAGAVSGTGQWLAMREELYVICAQDDRDEIVEAAGTLPVRTITGDVTDLERIVRDEVSGTRAHLERAVVADATEAGHHPLVVDGDLSARPAGHALVGVAKTLRTRYLPDETVLFTLPYGWRSPRFRIGGGTARYSCYLRMFDATRHAWDYGMVRLESYDPDMLDGLAALCLRERQGIRSSDGRFDRHLAPVRMCEDMLRARRPPAFTL